MKNIYTFLFLLMIMAACTGSASSQGKCSDNGDVCVNVRAVEPIYFGKPVVLTITVTSLKNIDDLGISLFYDVDASIDDLKNWEKNIQQPNIFNGGASWKIAISERQSLKFTRKLYLPTREGEFSIIVMVTGSNFRINDSLRIYMTQSGGKVYLSGTSLPITEGPLPTMNPSMLQTLLARPTDTSYPKTIPISPIPLGITPTSPAYPPPGSPTPSSLPHSTSYP